MESINSHNYEGTGGYASPKSASLDLDTLYIMLDRGNREPYVVHYCCIEELRLGLKFNVLGLVDDISVYVVF